MFILNDFMKIWGAWLHIMLEWTSSITTKWIDWKIK